MKRTDPSYLFTLRFRLHDGMATIDAFEDATIHYPGTHTRLDARLVWNGREIFPRGATYCGIPGHKSIDGKAARELVTSLFCLTDREYIDACTAEQRDWLESHAEELDMARMDRFCDENGNVRE
jgi:hypothetical protein